MSASMNELQRLMATLELHPDLPQVVTQATALNPANKAKGLYSSFTVVINSTNSQNSEQDLQRGVRNLSTSDSTVENVGQAITSIVDSRVKSWKRLSVALDRNYVHSAQRMSQIVHGGVDSRYDPQVEIKVYTPWSQNAALTEEQTVLRDNLMHAIDALEGVKLLEYNAQTQIQNHDIVVIDMDMPNIDAANQDGRYRVAIRIASNTQTVSVRQFEEYVISEALNARAQELSTAQYRGPVNSQNANVDNSNELKQALQNLIV